MASLHMAHLGMAHLWHKLSQCRIYSRYDHTVPKSVSLPSPNTGHATHYFEISGYNYNR